MRSVFLFRFLQFLHLPYGTINPWLGGVTYAKNYSN